MPEQPATPEVRAAAAAVEHWLRVAVLGLNLCPFAHEPVRQRKLRLTVSTATTEEDLLRDLEDELQRLRDTPPETLETTLLVHPWVLQDFDRYSNFLAIADLSVRMLRLQGVVQIASFHPQYRFDGTDANDVANSTNRAPHPCLHLLREASVSRAIAGMKDPDAIYQRNIVTLQRLGHAGWRELLGEPAQVVPCPAGSKPT